MPPGWVDAGTAADLGEGQIRSIEVGADFIAIVRSGGQLFAFVDLCTHEEEALSGGEISGDQIACPRHGAKFCMRTGRALTPPAYEPLRTFETRIEDGRIWLRID